MNWMTPLLVIAAAPDVVATGPALQELVRSAQTEAAPALGAVVVRCRGGTEVSVAGLTRVNGGAPIAPHARFNIGSNAKSMLASLAATYVQEGKLRWDTRVADIFAAESASIDPQLAQVTLRQLLSHRSGLPAYASGADLNAVRVEGDSPQAQRLSFALHALRSPPKHSPGSTFLYSNAGYVVAGAMLERVGNRPFEDLMSGRLFQPLGITARFGTGTPDAGHPWGHVKGPEGPHVHEDPEPVIPAFLQPAGDVSLSLADYGRFLREHLCALQGRNGRVLSASTVAYLHEAAGGEEGGLGWGRFELGGQQASVHTGGTGTFAAYMAVIPGKDLAAATVTNSGAPEAGKAAMQLLLKLVSGEAPRSGREVESAD